MTTQTEAGRGFGFGALIADIVAASSISLRSQVSASASESEDKVNALAPMMLVIRLKAVLDTAGA